MNKAVDITGKRFGRLVAEARSSRKGVTKWQCLCDCGTRKDILLGSLRDGHTHSCGCLQKEEAAARQFKHGHSPNKTCSRTYRIWSGMMTRCNNPEDHAYARYGGRGINVCKRWHKFENFLADMGEVPPAMTLERRDNDKGYERANCCWATYTQQARNRSNSVHITVEGVTRCVAEWSRLLGSSYSIVHQRIAAGWDEVEACTTPVMRKFANTRPLHFRKVDIQEF